MKKIILICCLISINQITFGQLPVIETVVDIVCQDIKNSQVAVQDMMKEEVTQIFIEGRQDHLSAWDSTQRVFTQEVLLPFKYDEYFVRRLETECPSFRPAMKYYDKNLTADNINTKLYQKARDLFLALEDGQSQDDLNRFMDNSAPVRDAFWDILTGEVEKHKSTSTLRITQVDQHTFRCIYEDYMTSKQNLEMDLYFFNDEDVLINNVRMTTKFAFDQGYKTFDLNYDIDASPPVGKNN